MEAWIYARSTEPVTLDPAWSPLFVDDEAGRVPVLLEHVTDEAAVKKAVEELSFILDLSRPTKARDRIRELLAQTVRLFRMTFDDATLTPDVRAALPTIAASIAKSTDGIIRYPERGRSDVFLDANSKRIYRL